MPTIGRLAIDIAANTSELRTGIDQARAQVTGFRRTVETTGASLLGLTRIDFGRLRGSLTAVGVAATGVSGPVGQLASTLVSLTAGGGIAAGVVAGITAIATAYRLLTKEAREAKEAADKLVESLREQARTPQLKAREQFQVLNRRAADLQRELASAERGTDVFDRTTGGIRTIVDEGKVARLRAELAGIQEAALQVGKNLTEALSAKPDKLTPQLKRLSAALDDVASKAEALGELSIGHNLGALRDQSRLGIGAKDEQRLREAVGQGGLSDAMRGVGGERGASPYREFLEQTASAAAQFEETWGQAQEATAAGFAGLFAQAIQGTLSLKDLLKGLLAQILGSLVQRLISGAFAGVLHEGGIVGAGGRSRAVDPMLFVGAPRLHKGGLLGLAPDEVPIIAQRGERVLSRAEVAAGAGRPSAPTTVQVQQQINFSVSAMDGPSVDAMLRSRAGVIAGVVAQAASDAPNFARHVVSQGLR